MSTTSFVVRFFKAVAGFLACGTNSSIFIKIFRKTASFFVLLWKVFTSSVVFRFLCLVADSIAECYGNSRLHRALTGEELEKDSKSSLFYRVYATVVAAVTGFLAKVLLLFAPASSSSVAFSSVFATHASGEKSYRRYTGIFGFIIAIMFCVPHTMWNNFYGFIISLVLFALVIYGYAAKKENALIYPYKTYLSLILFFASITLSLFVSRNLSDSIRIYVFFITSILLCVCVSIFASEKKAFRSICGLLFGCVVVTGVVGIVQAILKVEADASLTDLTLNADMPGRVFSTMGNPNNFAQVLVLFMPFALAYALSSKGKFKKLVLCTFMLIPFAALLQTYSRSGWIAFAVSAVVFTVLSNRRAVPFMFLLCLLAVPLLPEAVLNRILTIGNLEDSSSSYRLVIWQGALEMLGDVWATGVGIGPGAFKSIFPVYAYGTTAEVAHCHMQFLEVFLETGIIGFISFSWMTLTVIKRSFVSSSSKDKEVKYFAAAAAASMTGIIFIGFFEYYWFYPRVMFSFFISTGLAIAVYRMSRDENRNAG